MKRVNYFLMFILVCPLLWAGVIMVTRYINRDIITVESGSDVSEASDDATEVGWCPIVRGIQQDTLSGMRWVTVSLDGETNNQVGYRVCFVAEEAYGTNITKVFVVEKKLPPWNQRVYFAMKYTLTE